MAKPKTKNWVRKNFSLSEDAALKLKELAAFEGMTETEFVEFLISNWDSGIDPEAKLNKLLNERKSAMNHVNKIESKIKETSDQIALFSDWKKEKAKKKGNALQVLERLIVNKEFEEAERVSRVWQKMTGIGSLELVMEAKENVQKRGI